MFTLAPSIHHTHPFRYRCMNVAVAEVGDGHSGLGSAPVRSVPVDNWRRKSASLSRKVGMFVGLPTPRSRRSRLALSVSTTVEASAT